MLPFMHERRADSHKGENGKVAVVGGSKTIHGAPILSALAAERSGVDLVFAAVPACHAIVARMRALNVQVHPFLGDELQREDVGSLLELLATMDAAVIGPGLSRDPRSLAALQELMSSAPCPLVLDASALQPWTLQMLAGKRCVCTPHLGELERMGIAPEKLAEVAHETGIVLHQKGPVDRIAGPDGLHEIRGGNAGLTVGGTGDVLAGLIGGLIAQGNDLVEASLAASTIVKRAGSELHARQGFAYRAEDVLAEIPSLLRSYEK